MTGLTSTQRARMVSRNGLVSGHTHSQSRYTAPSGQSVCAGRVGSGAAGVGSGTTGVGLGTAELSSGVSGIGGASE